MVTGARILLLCFLGLCYTKDINLKFLPLKFSVLPFFSSTSNGVSYLALINRFGGLKMRGS